MKQQIPYAKTSETIIGYSDSDIAKSESNDCVVRSFASAFDMSYDEAHKLASEKFGRKNRKGVALFTMKMGGMIDRGETINDKKFEKLPLDGVRMENKSRFVTFNQFFKKHKKGVYLIVVRGHAFTLKNGIVIGNTEDATRLKARINTVYKVS
jgi:hypothetical protein